MKIVDCRFVGLGPINSSGLNVGNGVTDIVSSIIKGDTSGIEIYNSSKTYVQNSRVVTDGVEPAYKITNNLSRVFSSGVFFDAGSPVIFSTLAKYVHCLKSNYDPVDDGEGSLLEP